MKNRLSHPLPPPGRCAVEADARQVTALGSDMVKALRRLRQDLQACPTCLHKHGCPIRRDFNRQVDAAIQQALEEWNLPSHAQQE